MSTMLVKERKESPHPTITDWRIQKNYEVAPYQQHKDNKALITIQNFMERGADTIAAPHGLIVGAHNGMPIYAEVEASGIAIGNPGSGKTSTVATSNLLAYQGSVVSLEIGGATFKRTYNYRKHILGQDIYLFDPQNVIGLGCSNYNPMDDLIPEEPDFYRRVNTMACTLISDSEGHKEQDPYFRKNPSGLIAAMTLYLKLADKSIVPDEQKNFIYMTQIFSKFPSEVWETHIRKLKEWTGDHHILLNQFGDYLSGAQPSDQNVRSIVSATTQWLSDWAADKRLGQRMLSSDFSMMDLREKKTTLYIVMPTVEDYITYQPWLRLIFQSGIDSTPNPGDGGKNFKQEDRILFMLDELTQLGHLQAVATGALTLRQKGIILYSLFQNYASLQKVYGEEEAASFMGSAEAIQFLRSHDVKTIEYISKRLGRYLVHVPSVSERQSLQISVGEQGSVAEGTVNQKNRQEAESQAVTHSKQQTETRAETDTSFRNWGSATAVAESVTTSNAHTSGEVSSNTSGASLTTGTTTTTTVGGGDSKATMVGDANTQGISTQRGTTITEGTSLAESKTTQKGENRNESFSAGYDTTSQPMLIEGLDSRQIEEAFSDEKQILFFNGKVPKEINGKIVWKSSSHCTLDDQARYYEIPFLRERAEGPPIPEVPAFPDPPQKTVFRLMPMSPVALEDFELDDSKLNWKPKEPVVWQAPAKLSEWGQGVKETCERYRSALYQLDKFDENPGFFNSFFRNPYVKAATAAGVATTCYFGGSIMAAGITFGALMLTGMAQASWNRHKLVSEKNASWENYTNMRGAAMKMVKDQLVPVMEAHDTNTTFMDETVQRQHELVAGNEKMEAVLRDRHEVLKERIEEHRANFAVCKQIFDDLRSGSVSGWSSGDWVRYVGKLHNYGRVREKFFDFDKGDYLDEPVLVTPTKLGPPPPKTLSSKTAPMPEKLEAEPLEPKVSQELAVIPEKGAKTREELENYFNMPLKGYDLPDGIETVGDAVERRAELTSSKKRRDRFDVKQMDNALEGVEDPHLEKFDGLVRDYVTGLRADEDSYHELLRRQIREGQQNVMNTISKIRQFNGQVQRLDDAQSDFRGFAERLDEVRAAAHHRAHARAIRDMEDMERAFEIQTKRLEERGPLVPPKLPRQRPELKNAQPSK